MAEEFQYHDHFYIGAMPYAIITEGVAPTVERWTPNPRVASSNLVALIFFHVRISSMKQPPVSILTALGSVCSSQFRCHIEVVKIVSIGIGPLTCDFISSLIRGWKKPGRLAMLLPIIKTEFIGLSIIT